MLRQEQLAGKTLMTKVVLLLQEVVEELEEVVMMQMVMMVNQPKSLPILKKIMNQLVQENLTLQVEIQEKEKRKRIFKSMSCQLNASSNCKS